MMEKLHLFYNANWKGKEIWIHKNPQKALPLNILKHLHDLAITAVEKAGAELLIGTFFFAMRSCKYSSITGEWKTKLLCIKNITFYKTNKPIQIDNPSIALADYMKIVFELTRKTKCHGSLVGAAFNPAKENSLQWLKTFFFL